MMAAFRYFHCGSSVNSFYPVVWYLLLITDRGYCATVILPAICGIKQRVFCLLATKRPTQNLGCREIFPSLQFVEKEVVSVILFKLQDTRLLLSLAAKIWNFLFLYPVTVPLRNHTIPFKLHLVLKKFHWIGTTDTRKRLSRTKTRL